MHAVVIGAGVAGLAAARVLAERFGRVTLLERDPLPGTDHGATRAGPVDRPGVPQGPHPHALLVAGRDALDRLFPGLGAELVAHGAVAADAAGDIVFWQFGAFRSRFPSGIEVISATRALLEGRIRRRVAGLPAVDIRDATPVRALIGEPGARVRGVTLADGERVTADLVVDATGRAGSGAWLRALDLPAPAETVVRVRVGYRTRMLRRRAGDLDGLLLAGIAESPPRTRFGVAFAVDGDRWQVTLGGWHGTRPPGDPAGFAAFAAGLPHPLIADLLARAEPLGPIRAHQFPASRRRYFERLRHPPAGYVAIGDAVCSVNPIYGQGMTMAVLQSLALGHSLDRSPADPVPGYYRAAGRIVTAPWWIATGADYLFPQTEGRRPPGLAPVNRYVRRVVLGTHVSPALHLAMLRVQHLIAPPASLLRPGIVARALWHSRHSP